MIDLSFYKRGEYARSPIVIKDSTAIWKKTQDISTLILVALFSGMVVYLIWGGR